MLFEIKIKRSVIDDMTGKDKVQNEHYLCSAATFGEAEEQAHRLAELNSFKEWRLLNITPCNLEEIICLEEKDYFQNLTASYVGEDDNGKLKTHSLRCLIAANSPKEAIDVFKQWSKDFTIDYTVKKVSQSRIIEVMFEILKEELTDEPV